MQDGCITSDFMSFFISISVIPDRIPFTVEMISASSGTRTETAKPAG